MLIQLCPGNIARRGRATQSSIFEIAVAGRAIDGNGASNWRQGSCTHTRKDFNPWWRLDLLKSYKVSTVTITNRQDCCPERLNGAEIRIGNSLNANGNANPRCAMVRSIKGGASKTFQCYGMVGRYVNIVIPGRQEYLTLCEVEVYGVPSTGTNIARGGKVTQSTLYGKAVPERAIDGNRASNWGQGSCTHTQKNLKPWWRLDLQKSYTIHTVTITNRKDCCQNRINGAEIRIGNSLSDNGNANPRCTVISSIPAGNTKTFQCNGMVGRYVNIVIPGRKEYLTLCEVEVYGEPSAGTNIARGGKVTQSTLYGKAVPERAIDGNRASNWGQASCSATMNNPKPWWRLDLLRSYKINTITITNRRDCCPNRINGAEIRIGNSLSDNGNANPRCTVISSIPAGNTKTFQCNGMVGRYVNIVIPGRKEYLTLCEVEVYGEPSAGTNIARGGKVTQSTLYGKAVPERAIDGNRASNWGQGSCTHTQKNLKPWWRLDLQKSYKIHTVTITNRKDCCQNRINGAEIRIGNSLSDNGNANPRCTVISSIPAGNTKTFQCNGMVGRYVNIVIPGRKEYLTLCEVEVYGEPSAGTNIARGGKVTQSTLYGKAVPERAIDGNRASNWGQGSCTHTQKNLKPWWRLDLQKSYKIHTVTITNRKDCCQNRINGAEIRIGNSLSDNGNANPRCTVISSIPAGNTKTFQCNGMVGRYVNIVIPGRKEYLTLCEVEVYGEPSAGTNIARGGKVTQSTLYGKAVPERAIDGNRASNWGQASCSATMNNPKPWWRLDLLRSYKINTITITNRRDCCPNRINGAEIRIGNSLSDNGNANPRCTVISSIPAGNTKTFQCNGMVGRYVNIVIPGRKEYLTLCEVEVYGEPSAGTNIARGGKVTQSTLYGKAVPERAIDGNRASNWGQGSCTHTQKNLKPWWRLDLQKSYKIHTVTITNRKDCCQNRINGAEIRIGNSLSDNGNANPRCTVISSIPAGNTKTFQCNGMVGRYVNIVIPGRKEYLTLCEVEVYGEPSAGTNIARGGKVTQSTLYGKAVPERAIDGNRASNWGQASCSATMNNPKPWWRLDLLKSYKINTITITNRRDCCPNRINGAEIRIGNSLSDNGNANPRCTVISSIPAGNTKTFQCNGMVGRYVNIVIPGRKEYLTLCEVEVYGEPSAGTNIARGGKVTQSTLYGKAVPERAIDGNRASNWGQGSCTHTQKNLKPWWRLDLQKSYKIHTVTITNRKDCCQNRINGAEIRIGNSLSDNGNANPRCTVISSIPAGNTKTFQCNGMVGRYVNIVIPGRKEYLTLCEVEVYGEPSAGTNIARGGKVTQSTLYGKAVPERAIDGNRASNWGQASCSATMNNPKPWWRLDLLKSYKINTITITNRRDCCPNRINGAEIRIGNSLSDNGNANPRCTVISSIPAGNTKTFQCNGMVGRYVNIVIPGRKEYLTLCEVEVYGEPSAGTNIARGGKVTQSTLYGKAVPERAIDGNRASNWGQGSCTHTQKNLKPWWRLDLQKSYKIHTVTITNRKDCCQNRINGAEIRIGNSLSDNGNANPRCTVISSIPAGNTKTFQCNGMVGRYVNIVIPGRKEYLTLCEVEVYGEPSAGTNIARGGKVTQSTLYGKAVPERAIDGNRASNWGQASCSATMNNPKPWWRLDLLRSYKINTITITNRRDCCPNRINGAEIRIGNSLSDNGNANPRCTVISSIPAGNTKTFQCNGMVGRYVNIVIPGRKEYLTLCEVEVYGEPSAGTNIARGGKVTQSTLYGKAVPERAIDGNRASNWGQGSCTHTQKNLKPWWRLDLQKSYKIHTVTITNRKDCCQNRINGAEIRIGNSLSDNGNANPRCTVISSIPAGNTKTFQCNGMVGRYVNIVIPGRKEYLTLCEVEVYGEPSAGTNIARGGKVTQSTLYGKAVPERAIDGNRASNWGQASCSATMNNPKPWWRLDLLRSYKINTITITNRRDCCPNRINGAEIRIGNSLSDNGNANPRCTVISSIPAGNTKTFQCNGMVGRYVNIVIPGRKEYLTLCEVEVYGEPSAGTNIARGGKVTQSTLYGKAVPERAIDGNRASNWGQGSCTHTQKNLKPWWRLDLQKSYKIHTVTITNRKDCCQNRINGAEIRIGNSLSDNGNANPRCTVISSIPAGNTKTFQCNGMVGRYVNIVIPGRKEYLTLCEVEVYGEPSAGTNIARGGKVTQSTLYGKAVPERAIDGNRASNWGQGSCTHTQKNLKPWWRLDLQKSYKIHTVTITNRKDCCQNRINGAEIRIGNSLSDNGNANPRCTVISSIPAGNTKTFQCNGMVGRYVNIVIPGRKEYLTLCEVEVYGEPSAGTNIARGGKVTQSTLYGKAVPERAIDGNRASNWGQGSCTHTQKNLKPWWRLDLQKSYKIHTVTITNRKDCCQNRINGAEIRIGNSLSDNGNANPRCTVISSIPAGNTKTFQCNGMVGRYVNIVIPGRKEYLTLCEVEVYGEPSAGTNIARGGKVTQSTLYGKAVPERAIDGNRASNWGQGSCTHTQKNLKPWWRLDLQKSYKIHTVTITNRKDCCQNRINGAEIRIGNSLSDNGNANPRCTVISSIPAGNTKTFQCNGMVGRYVNIVIPGRKEYLTLCEVEVYGEPSAGTNIARGGKVTQSTLYGKAVPERAIDGNRASNWGQGSCTHTQKNLKPWWRLDLQKSYKIHTVTITNRKDCCQNRINGAEIRIGNSLSDNGNANPRCTVISSIPAGNTKTFQCNGMVGRYVNIVIPGRKEYLTLCEVEVYGEPSAGTNIARGGKVTQSTLYGKAVPERAIDGNRASNWGQGSCTHTQKNLKPWWRLDLQKLYKINTVTITNRKDCCQNRINGAEIRIGNSLSDNGNANPRCTVISSIPAGTSKTFQCNGMVGRYVNIVIPGRKEYLTLCEVEVYGEESEYVPLRSPQKSNTIMPAPLVGTYDNCIERRFCKSNLVCSSAWPEAMRMSCLLRGAIAQASSWVIMMDLALPADWTAHFVRWSQWSLMKQISCHNSVIVKW
ncbi:uncharacterized protein LOC133983374 [Scomber scombrus]|uniref:uncharacterized protein LOC133983374 n=1 Tax=Scomber scombrus TaxID=13677 RepID=UPI002DDC26E3|nr:uncharacterized protein LOC133983374 [Scomber scombrus]